MRNRGRYRKRDFGLEAWISSDQNMTRRVSEKGLPLPAESLQLGGRPPSIAWKFFFKLSFEEIHHGLKLNAERIHIAHADSTELAILPLLQMRYLA